MKVKMSRRLVLGAVFLLFVLGGRLLYMCEAKKDQTVCWVGVDSTFSEDDGERLSAREIRIRADAQRLRASGRCSDDRTARAAAEAKEEMRRFLGR